MPRLFAHVWNDRHLPGLAATFACLLLVVAPAADAQMLGAPVLQNAFSNPGFTVAVNFGTSSDAKTFGAAGAWAPASGRFQVSLGGGSMSPRDGKGQGTYGGRVAVPVFSFMEGKAGAAVFAGLGGASAPGARITTVPAGLAVGFRQAMGETRGFSVYAAPFYAWTRVEPTDEPALSKGLIRVSGGLDLGITRKIGVTLGYEAGARAGELDPGPRGGVFGVAASYAFGRR